MSTEIRRPPHGYAIDLYFELQRAVRDLPGVINRTQAHIASQQDYLARCEQDLVNAVSTLVWMQEHQADEIEAGEDHRVAVIARLKEAGWFKDRLPPSDGHGGDGEDGA